MNGHGYQGFEGFIQALREVATDRSALLAGQLAAPVTVSVSGRPGVGVRTVVHALRCAGVPVEQGDDRGDLAVRVIAEVAKLEDVAAMAPAAAVLVFNKADVNGLGGPEIVRRRCAELTVRTGVWTVPMIAVLAVASLDPTVVDAQVFAALQTLAVSPADLTSTDAFVSGDHELAAPARRILAERLDLFGIASAVLALRAEPGIDISGVRQVLHAASGIDDVCAEITRAVAEVRYRRLLAVAAELEALAGCDPAAAAFVSGDQAVRARAAAAAEVLRANGVDSDVPTAVRWRNYGAGPVSALHREAAADLMKATLRGWARSGR